MHDKNCPDSFELFLQSEIEGEAAEQQHSDSAILWKHMDLSDSHMVEWLESSSGLDEAITATLTADETRPRLFKFKQGILLILRGINTNPGDDPEDMVSLRIWIELKRVVSVRRRNVLAVCDMYQDVKGESCPKQSGEFIVQLIDKLADRIGDFVEVLEDDIAALEEFEQSDPQGLRRALGGLRRKVAVVRRYLAPQRDALDRLFNLDTPIFTERDRLRLRDETDRIVRYLEELDLIRERALVLQEAMIADLAQQQNNRMYVLSIVAAIFLPLGFLTGLLGINVGGMPGADSQAAFWLVCGGLGVLVVFIFGLFRWAKWL